MKKFIGSCVIFLAILRLRQASAREYKQTHQMLKDDRSLKSSACPHLPAGIRSIICLLRVSSLISASFISVAMYPGTIPLTFTPFAAHSLDKAFVS